LKLSGTELTNIPSNSGPWNGEGGRKVHWFATCPKAANEEVRFAGGETHAANAGDWGRHGHLTL